MDNNLTNRISTFFQSRKSRIFLVVLSLGIGIGIGYRYSLIHNFFVTQQNKRPSIIIGKIITLKKLQEDQFIPFHDAFSSTVRKDLEFPETITLDYTIRHLKSEMKKDRERKIFHYCIFDNNDQKLVGGIQIREKNPKDPGQFGCWLNEKYWGGGRIQEAMALISKSYFAQSDADHFTAHVRLWNQRSYRALKKFGFIDTGFYYENGEPTRYLLEYRRP